MRQAADVMPGKIRRDAGSAIVRERVVPLGMTAKVFDPLQILKEQTACVVWLSERMVEPDIFSLPEVGAQAHHIALVRNQVDEFILAEESAQCGISLANSFSLLDGHRDECIVPRIVPKLKTYGSMRNQG